MYSVGIAACDSSPFFACLMKVVCCYSAGRPAGHRMTTGPALKGAIKYLGLSYVLTVEHLYVGGITVPACVSACLWQTGTGRAVRNVFKEGRWEGNSLKRVSPHAPLHKLLGSYSRAGPAGTAAQNSLERGPGENLSPERFPPANEPGLLEESIPGRRAPSGTAQAALGTVTRKRGLQIRKDAGFSV